MVIKDVIELGVRILKESNIENPLAEARIILAEALMTTKEHIIGFPEDVVSSNNLDKYCALIEKRKKHIPMQYVLGRTEFMKLNFNINENVLVPSPDTEILVEEVLKIYNKEYYDKKVEILDLCTGSGAIGISLAKYIENSVVYVSDINKNCLDTAIENANLNGVYRKMFFKYADLFNEIANDEINSFGKRIYNMKFDFICSNPPYIPTSEMAFLQKEVQHEPRIALDGGKDGLDFYRKIAKHAKEYLNLEGYLFLEIGFNQRAEVIELLKKENGYTDIYCVKDLGRKQQSNSG